MYETIMGAWYAIGFLIFIVGSIVLMIRSVRRFLARLDGQPVPSDVNVTINQMYAENLNYDPAHTPYARARHAELETRRKR